MKFNQHKVLFRETLIAAMELILTVDIRYQLIGFATYDKGTYLAGKKLKGHVIPYQQSLDIVQIKVII